MTAARNKQTTQQGRLPLRRGEPSSINPRQEKNLTQKLQLLKAQSSPEKTIYFETAKRLNQSMEEWSRNPTKENHASFQKAVQDHLRSIKALHRKEVKDREFAKRMK